MPARAPRRRDPQPPDQRAGPRPRPAGHASTTSSSSRGTATRCTQVFDALEFRVLRDRLFETLSADEPAGRRGGRARRRAARRRRGRPAGSPSTPAADTLTGVVVAGHWGSGTGEVARGRPRDAGRRAPPGSTSPSSRPTTRSRSPAGWPTRSGRRRCTTPRARCWRWRRAGWPLAGLAADTALSAYLSHPDQRSYDLADLTLRYLHRELKAADAGADQLTLRARRRLGGGRRRDAQGARGRRPGRRARDRARDAAAGRSCSPTSSCRWSTCLARMERTGIAVDVDHLTSLEARVRRAGQAGGRRRVRR